jgi:putative ABC transport system substrate-binding protein
MRRRELVLGGAALAPVMLWPLATRAQQPPMPVIGFLTSLGQNDRPNLANAFRRGLREAGYVEGRNLAIEYRFAENQLDRLPALVTDPVGRKVAVIAATGGGSSVWPPRQRPPQFRLSVPIRSSAAGLSRSSRCEVIE